MAVYPFGPSIVIVLANPALFGIFPRGWNAGRDAGVGIVHNIALPPSQLKLSIHKFRHGFGTPNYIDLHFID